MTLDVIYPMRKFVFRAIRHSPAISVVLTNRRPPRIIARPRETHHPTEDRISSCFSSHPFSFLSSPSGCFAFFVWHDVEIDDRESRGPSTRVFHFRVFGRVNNAIARLRGNDFLFRELLNLMSFFTPLGCSDTDERRF